MAFGIPEGFEEIEEDEEQIPEGFEPVDEREGFLWRNEIMSELDEDPETRRLAMQMLDTEGGGAATMEALVNRTAMIREKIPGWTINDELNSGFYGPINRGYAQTIEIDPSREARYQQDIDEVRAGSNIIQGRTDQGYPGDPNWRGPGRVHVPDAPKEIYNYWTGERAGVSFTHEDSAEFANKVTSAGGPSQPEILTIPEGYEEIAAPQIPEGYEEIKEEGKKPFFATEEEEQRNEGKGPNYPMEEEEPIRSTLFPGEDKYFRAHPEVGGMAAEDDKIILNPYSPSNVNKDAIIKNEGFRLKLRKEGVTPDFKITDEQKAAFKDTPYGKDENALKQTIAARIFSGDPSAKATQEQQDWVNSYTGLTPRAIENQKRNTANRERLIAAIAKQEDEGYPVPHFIGTENEPEGDRGPTRDMEQLVGALARQETNAVRARDLKEAARIGKERAFWEEKIKTEGMTAEQWKKQTGEEDPRYPHEPAFTAKQSPIELIDSVETAINAGKEIWEGGKRGLMQAGVGLGETINRYAYSPIVHGIREAIDYIAPDSSLAKVAKHVDDEFYKNTVAIPAAQREQLAKEGAQAGVVGQIAQAVGQMAGDLPSIMLTSGLLPELKVGMELVNTLRHGAAAMTVPAMRAGTDAAEQVKKDGGNDFEQLGAFIRGTTITMGIGSFPMATKSGAATLGRRIVERSVQSVPLASAAVESERMVDNLASDLFGGEKRPFSIEEHLKGALPMVLLGGVAGRSTAKSKFEKTFGFNERNLDKADYMRRRMEAEGIAKATPEKVMEWNAEFKKQEGEWPEEAPVTPIVSQDVIEKWSKTNEVIAEAKRKAKEAAAKAAPEPGPVSVKRSAQALGIVASPKAAKGFEQAREEAKNIADYLNKAEHWGPWNSAVGNNVAAEQKAYDNVIRQAKAWKKEAPDESAQEGMTMYREADGDMRKIIGWGANVKDPKAKAVYRAAGALKPNELSVLQKGVAKLDALRKWLNLNGIDVAEVENYVTHMFHTGGGLEPTTGLPKRSLSSYFKYAKPRKYPSYFAALQAGEKPKTYNFIDIVSAYEILGMRAVNNQKFVDRLKFGQARDGNPMVAPDKMEFRKLGYKSIENVPGLQRLVVHPEFQAPLGRILGRSRIQEWLEERSNNPLLNVAKGVLGGVAESQKYAKGTMFSFSLFHQVTEGTHALGHRVNPFNIQTKEIDLNDPEQYDAAVHGLMLRPDRASQEQFIQGSGTTNYNLVTKMARRFGGDAGKGVADLIDGYTHYLFEDWIPRLKMDTYRHIVERNMARFADDLKSGKTTPAAIKSLSADQANAAYGHLNYTKMARSKTVQHALQLAFLAPDFFEARARFAAQAGKGAVGLLTGSKTGTEQLIALANLAIGQYVAARILNQLDHGDPEWDVEHAFAVKTDLNGLLPDKRWISLRSVPEDILKAGAGGLLKGDINQAVKEAGRFAQVRLAAYPRLITDNVFGHNWRGEKTDFAKSLRDMVGNVVPMPMQGWADQFARVAPVPAWAEKWVRPDTPASVSAGESLLKSMGVQIHRVSPINDVFEMKDEWLKVNDPEEYDRQQSSTFPASKYRGLRYALEDSDWEAARKEAKKLREGGATTETFHQSLMRPFTGSFSKDQRFYQSLDKEGKALYDAALRRRIQVLERYKKHVNPRSEMKRVTVETLHKRMREAEREEKEKARKKKKHAL